MDELTFLIGWLALTVLLAFIGFVFWLMEPER